MREIAVMIMHEFPADAAYSVVVIMHVFLLFFFRLIQLFHIFFHHFIKYHKSFLQLTELSKEKS